MVDDQHDQHKKFVCLENLPNSTAKCEGHYERCVQQRGEVMPAPILVSKLKVERSHTDEV